ncbi:DUF1496 domain-containing protein [Microcoleus sp. K1-B1]|uniref:DUF1496 domain-containing protein n=1 Tax=unclassified Microcoleus TaxID=2642155 RepID=UPI002FD7A50F
MLNRKQILSMAFLAIGVTMIQTTALASPTPVNAPTNRITQPRIVKDCYYAGQRYSEGSVIKGSDGVQVQCSENRWVLKS